MKNVAIHGASWKPRNPFDILRNVIRRRVRGHSSQIGIIASGGETRHKAHLVITKGTTWAERGAP